MNKQETARLFESLENQADQLKKLHTVLLGDEFGQYPGLIEEQKRDNKFREEVSANLSVIMDRQEAQLVINQDVKDRLESLESFANFFKTLGRVKKQTWWFVGGAITLMGLFFAKVEQAFKWLMHFMS